MSADVPHADGEELQFERAVSKAQVAPTSSGQPAVVCKACSKKIDSDYYQLNGVVTCARCRTAIADSIATPKGAQPFVRALGLGILAAIAGAAIYYGVIKLAHLEIGIIAVAIGYMVGWAVKKGAGDHGGRRFQILAVLLTYWSVGLAYAPLFMENSTMTPAMMFFEIWILPVLVITSGGSGILTAIIIGVGMRQAWRMTGAPPLTIAGPFRVGGGTAAAAV